MKVIYASLFCLLFLASCMQYEAEFSCDPVINEYVSDHQAELSQMSLSDLTSSDLPFQQAVFRSYDPAKKREVWLQKIQFLLETQKYTADEYTHIESLRTHLHENYFATENLISQEKERAQFASDWISHAKSRLGWSERTIAFVVYRLYTNESQFDAELNGLNSIQRQATADSEGSCSCNTTSDFCGVYCGSGNCQVSTGCGWMWSETCNGVCY